MWTPGAGRSGAGTGRVTLQERFMCALHPPSTCGHLVQGGMTLLELYMYALHHPQHMWT
ncbi:hypothetical protein NDU88_000340, partial [Pleurodeles waltl]